MKCVWEIIREFAELSEVLIFIFLFLNVKIARNRRSKIMIIIITVIIILLRTVFLRGAVDEQILVYEILDFLIIWNLIDLPVKRKAVIYLFAYICIGEINIIIIWLLSQHLESNAEVFLINNNLRCLIYLLLSLIMIVIHFLKKLRKVETKIEISTKSYIVFLIVLIPIVYYSGHIFYFDENNLPDKRILYSDVKILLIAVMLFANTLGIIILTEERKADKEKIIFQNELIELQKIHYIEMKEKQQELREVRHDMKAHLIQITQLYKLGNVKKFEKYLNKLEEHWDYNKNVIIDSGNYTADIIISYYLNLANIENVKFTCSGRFLEGLLIDEYDLCSLLFNGISNAYEECKRLKESDGFVKITIKNYQKILFLTISNTYREESGIISEWMTSKMNKEVHGYGVTIIKKTADKYNGNINYSIKDKMMNLEIILPDIYKNI